MSSLAPTYPHQSLGPLLSRHLNVVVGGGSVGTASGGAGWTGGVRGGVRVRKLPKNPLELGKFRVASKYLINLNISQ